MKHAKCEYAYSSQSNLEAAYGNEVPYYHHVEPPGMEIEIIDGPNVYEKGHSSSTAFPDNNNENYLSKENIISHIQQNPSKSMSEIGKVIQNSVYIVLAY